MRIAVPGNASDSREPARKRKWRPSGRNHGQRCVVTLDAGSIDVTGTGSPPPADTRKRFATLEKTMTPSRFQVPPLANPGAGNSHTVKGRPPDRSIVLSLLPEKKAT